MEVGLKSAFQNLYQKYKSHLSLFLKSATFGLAVLIMAIGDFQLIPILFFAIVSLFLYLRPFFEFYPTFFAFISLTIVSVLGMKILSGTFLFLPGILLFSFVFCLVLGIKDLIFIKRSRWYYVAALIIFYSIFIVFFLSDKSDLFLLKYGAVIIAIFLILKEWLAILTSFSFPKREFLVSAAAALASAQILWAIALLPIGFINAATFMLLFIFIISEFLYKHFIGGISKQFLIQYSVLFLLLTIFILRTANWSLSNF